MDSVAVRVCGMASASIANSVNHCPDHVRSTCEIADRGHAAARQHVEAHRSAALVSGKRRRDTHSHSAGFRAVEARGSRTRKTIRRARTREGASISRKNRYERARMSKLSLAGTLTPRLAAYVTNFMFLP
jgi:hypothetical protein